MSAPRDFKLIVVLALIAGLGPITIHVILPILPTLEATFQASNALVQLTLTLAVVVMAISTIAYGPAADRYGRKPVAIFGLIVFIGGSGICIWSPDIETLILGRVVQAFGGGAGMVVSRAIIRDLYSREQSAKIIGHVMSVVVLAPILAPVIGGFIVEFAGWHWVFALATAMGMIALVVVIPGIRETHVPVGGGNLFIQMLRAFPGLLRTPAFVAYAGYAGCGMGMFMVIAGGMPFVMIEVFDRSPSAFGLFFMFLTSSFFIGTVLSSRLTERIGIDRMIRIGSAGAATFALLVPALVIAGWNTPWAVFLPGFCIGLFHGLAMPNAQAGAVSVNPAVAGSASGLLMFLQMSVGAGFGQVSGMLPHDGLLPVALLVGVAGAGSFLLYNIPMWRVGRRTS
jgi:DHA1 family bicyclomycin/chloramphenicol resistance-like MFS transporter